MQAAARAAIQEVARGLSTAAIVLAGTQTPQCTCICPSCPDCNCLGTHRACPVAPSPSVFSGFSVAIGFILGVVVALFVSAVTKPPRELRRPPLGAGPRVEVLEEELDVASVARQQSLQLRHGSRVVPRG